MSDEHTAIPCSDIYLDALRVDVIQHPTNAQNFRERAVALKLWAATLQQLGVNLKPYLAVEAIIAAHRFHVYGYVTDPDQEYLTAIDQGFAILESLLAAHGFVLPVDFSISSSSQPGQTFATDNDWPGYQRDMHHTGCTTAQGPTEGKCVWKFPISLGWRARPLIQDDYVYVASPGMRVSFYKLDKRTGRVIWKCRRAVGVVDDQLYHTPCIASTPVLVGNDILVREVGSRGNTGWSRHFVFIDQESGQETRIEEACHIDYRAGYAPFAADEKRIVYPVGIHDIEQSPPQASALDTIRCKDYSTGEVLWEFFVGTMFGEPVMTADTVFVGTLHGDVFGLKLEGTWPRQRRDRIRWYFKCAGAVNTPIVVAGNFVFVASNDGHIYALDKDSGQLFWKWHPGRIETRAFRLFSVPVVRAGRLYVGSADGYFYCLDVASGQLIWAFEIGEWLRAAPVVVGETIVLAAIDGTLYRLVDKGTYAEVLWRQKISTHHLLSDLVESDGSIYVAASDLYLYCIDTQGTVQWKHSLIESVPSGDVRVLTDQIAGGSYYTGKPTAVGNRAFIGTPSGFVHALDETTGEERWRFECGAAVSAAPMFYKGRIYFGQQGGEDWYYCLDASTGQLVWKQTIGWVWGSANVAQDRVFVPGIDGFANCLDANSGAILWRYRTSRSTCSEPTIDGDMVYFGGWDHYFYAFHTLTGQLLWKFHVDGACDSGTAVAQRGRIYLPSGDSDCFRCLDGKTGDVIWEFHRDKTNFNATPAFDGEYVYISINQGTGLCGVWIYSTICCLDAKTGKLIWEHEGGGIPGSVIAGDSVYFGSSESPFLYCVDKWPGPDGKARVKWRFNLTGRMWETTSAISNGKALVLSDNRYLCAIK